MSKKNVVGRFTLNFANKTIVGTQASFNKASKGSGPVYDELMKLVEKHPDFGYEIKEQKRKSQKPKRTYPGMDIEFIRDFIMAKGDANNLVSFNMLMAYAKKTNSSKYPLAKKFLFDVYDTEKSPFNYEQAKELVKEFRFTKALAEAARLMLYTTADEKDEFIRKWLENYEKESPPVEDSEKQTSKAPQMNTQDLLSKFTDYAGLEDAVPSKASGF